MDASDIIDALGGHTALAAVIGEQPRNVWRWRKRGIPARYWHRLADLAAQRGHVGITSEAMARPLWQRPA